MQPATFVVAASSPSSSSETAPPKLQQARQQSQQPQVGPNVILPTSPEEEAGRPAVRPIQNIIKKRRRLTSQEASMLNAIFEKCPKPTKTAKEMIAKKLNMSMRCIQIWFQNRRAKARKDNQLDPDDRVLSFTPQSEPTSYSGNNWLISTPVSSPSVSLDGEDPLFGEFFVGNNLAQTNLMLEQDIFRDPMITAAGTSHSFISTSTNAFISKNGNNKDSSSSVSSEASSLFSPGLDPLDFGGFDLGRPNLDYFASKQESELFDEWTTLKSRSEPPYSLHPLDFQPHQQM